jgi:hypothetical protein
MSLRRLSIEKMIALSKAFLEAHRDDLTKIPQAAGILVSIESSHNGLFRVNDQLSKAPAVVRELYQQQVKLDLQYDNYYRSTYYHLIALIALNTARGQESKVKELTALRDFVFPDGLAGVNFSYDEESGAATLLERSLTEEPQQQLKGIHIEESTTLLDLLLLQISIGKEIGALEQQKKEAQAAEQTNPGPTLRDQQRAAESWINAFRAMEQALRLAVIDKRLTKEAAKVFLRELNEAEEKADREYLTKKQAQAEPATK